MDPRVKPGDDTFYEVMSGVRETHF